MAELKQEEKQSLNVKMFKNIKQQLGGPVISYYDTNDDFKTSLLDDISRNDALLIDYLSKHTHFNDLDDVYSYNDILSDTTNHCQHLIRFIVSQYNYQLDKHKVVESCIVKTGLNNLSGYNSMDLIKLPKMMLQNTLLDFSNVTFIDNILI